MKNIKLLILVAFSFLATVVSAQTPAINSILGGGEFAIYYGGSTGDVIGYRFTVTAPISVTDMGVWNADNNGGLAANHMVGIWDDSQTLLTSGTATPGGTVVGAWTYTSVTPVTLMPGVTYTAGAMYTATDNDNYRSNPTVDTNPEVNITTSVFPASGSLGFVYPTNTSAGNGRHGPNFLFGPPGGGGGGGGPQACLNDPCVTVICPPDITVECIEDFTPDAMNATATTSCTTGSNDPCVPNTVFLEESFESGFPNGWTDNGDWEVDSDTESSNTGTDTPFDGAFFLTLETSSSSAGEISTVEFPLDLTGGNNDEPPYNMSFWYYMAGCNVGTLNINVSTDAGVSFVNVFSLTGEQPGQPVNGGVSSWLQANVDLTGFAGNDLIVQIEGINGTPPSGCFNFNGDIIVDLIQVSGCIVPPNNNTIVGQWVTQPHRTGAENCDGTTYVFTYKAADSGGNIGCCDQVVTIANADPMVTVSAGTTVECYEDIENGPGAAEVTVSCDSDYELKILPPIVEGEHECPGTTYTYTYRVRDNCGREATADRVFTIGNNAMPTIVAPPDMTISCDFNANLNPDYAEVTTGCTLGYTTTVSGP